MTGPEPRAPVPPRAAKARPTRGAVVTAALLGGGLVAAATLPAWVSGAVDDPVLGHQAIAATGRSVAPAVAGLGLVALAAGVVAAISAPVARVVAGALLLAAGLGAGALSARVALDPAGALRGSVSGALGASTTPTQAGVTPWPWLALLGAVVAAGAGVFVLVRGRSWSAAGARYVNPAGAASSGQTGQTGQTGSSGRPGLERRARSQAVDDWDSLSRGDDPTA